MLWSILVVLLLQGGPVEHQGQPDTIGVPQPLQNGWYNVRMIDGLYMFGRVDGSRPTRQGLMICLPMMGHDVQSFDPLLNTYERSLEAREGTQSPRWVRIDLRGHGKSVLRGKDSLSYKSMPVSEFLKYPGDVLWTIKGLVGNFGTLTDSSDITVVGASIGANTAALLTDSMPNISRLVLLSPGKDYHGLQPAEAIKKFRGQILLVATKGDTYSYEAVKYFHDLNPDHSTLLVYDGDAHATDILDTNPEAMKEVVNWLLKK